MYPILIPQLCRKSNFWKTNLFKDSRSIQNWCILKHFWRSIHYRFLILNISTEVNLSAIGKGVLSLEMRQHWCKSSFKSTLSKMPRTFRVVNQRSFLYLCIGWAHRDTKCCLSVSLSTVLLVRPNKSYQLWSCQEALGFPCLLRQGRKVWEEVRSKEVMIKRGRVWHTVGQHSVGQQSLV